MPTLKKEQTIDSLKNLVDNSSTVLFADYRGLTMKEFNNLRAKLRPENVKFQVVKNTLIRRATVGTPLEQMTQDLEGTTAAIFGLGDSIAPCKLLSDYIKEARSQMTIKGGVVDGHAYSGEQITAIAKLPPKEILLAQVIGSLQAPITNLAGTLNTMISSLAWSLQAVADQKSAG